MANNTSQEKAETKERTASPEKESKGDAEQTGTAGAKPLAAKSGYYYAHNQVSAADRPLVGAQTIYNHSPLREDEVKKLHREGSENGESAWNKGGTWEEKDFSKWAEGRLKELIPAIKTPAGLVVLIEVKSMDDCHASIVHSRGKKKASVEVEKLKIGWKASEGEAKGTLEVRELSSTNPDELQMSIKSDKKGAAEDQAKLDADLKAVKDLVKGVIVALREELMAK